MSTPSTGTVALIGAGEYLPAIAEVDQQLLSEFQAPHTSSFCPQRRYPTVQSLPNVGYKWALTISLDSVR